MRNRVFASKYNWLACLGALAACTEGAALPAEADHPETYSSAAAGSGALEQSGLGAGAGLALAAPKPTKQLTKRLGQLTGSGPNPYGKLNMSGTDLGVSFPIGDRLYFLFGDTLIPGWKWHDPERPELNLDGMAWTSRARPTAANPIPVLNWLTKADGTFQPFVVPDTAPLKIFSVPVEGLEIGNRVYLFFHITPAKTTNGSTDMLARWGEADSVIAHADKDQSGNYDFANLQRDETVHQGNFRSLSILRQGNSIWIYGTATYRHSPVWLAKATPDTLAKRSEWEYVAAYDPTLDDGVRLVGDPNDANPVVTDSCVGELSVRKHPARELYFMAYNCDSSGTNNIQLRYARHPSGPWSEAETILTTKEANSAPDKFLSTNISPFNDDMLGTGAIYGPYMVPEWFTDTSDGNIEIIYTLSSYVPYQVHLMRTVVSIPSE